MTIASEISRLQCAKSDIKTAIEEKWVEVWESVTLDDYANCIAAISSWPKYWCVDVLVVWWWWSAWGRTCSFNKSAWWWWAGWVILENWYVINSCENGSIPITVWCWWAWYVCDRVCNWWDSIFHNLIAKWGWAWAWYNCEDWYCATPWTWWSWWWWYYKNCKWYWTNWQWYDGWTWGMNPSWYWCSWGGWWWAWWVWCSWESDLGIVPWWSAVTKTLWDMSFYVSWWWNWVRQSSTWCTSWPTMCWWWWHASACWASVSNWANWLVVVAYKTDGSCWILPDSSWWIKFTCWAFTYHCFTSCSGSFNPIFK